MFHELPPYRPPNEGKRNSLLLRVTRGCPWNKCTFCDLYKWMKFEKRSVDELKDDIDAVLIFYELCGRKPRSAFIGDSDSPIIKAEDFREILYYLREKIPSIMEITSYARAKTILRKKTQHLESLRRTGLSRLHIGLETGSDTLLKKINKGATSEEMIKAGLKARDIGFEVSEYVILGLGGKELSEEHVKETAEVLSMIDPHFIRFRTLVPRPHTPIFDEYMNGDLKLLSPHEVLKEAYDIISNLDVKMTSWICFDHDSNPYPLPDRKLPEERENILKELESAMSIDEKYLTDAKDLIGRSSL